MLTASSRRATLRWFAARAYARGAEKAAPVSPEQPAPPTRSLLSGPQADSARDSGVRGDKQVRSNATRSALHAAEQRTPVYAAPEST